MEFENNTKGLLDKLIYLNEATVEREYIIAQLDGISMLEGELRDQRIGEYYMELFKHVFRDAIKYREKAANDLSVLKEDQSLRILDAQVVLNELTQAFDSYFAEKNIKPCEGKLSYGVDPIVIRDSIYSVCNEFKGIDTLKDAGQNRKLDLLNEMRENLEQLAKNGHRYDASDFSTDVMIEEMYVIHEERAAQFEKKSFFEKLRHPIDSIRTSLFLSKTEKALKKLGFNKEQHGPAVKERLAKEPTSILKTQMLTAKDNYKAALEEIKMAEWRKNNPILTVAQEKFEKARSYFEDKEHPERTFKTKVSHIIDKYNLEKDVVDKFTKVDLNYASMAKDYDNYRDTTSLVGQKETRFFELCRALVDASLQKNEPIDIKQIFRDVNEFLVTEFQTFSVLYERDDLKDLAKEGMMLKDNKLTFLQKKVLDAVKSKYDENEVERVKNDMQEIIDDFTNNREQYYEQEMQMLKESDEVKISIVVDELKEEIPDADLSKPVIEQNVMSKDDLVK